MAACIRDPIPMEGNVSQYWNAVLYGKLDSLKSIVSPDIVVESVVDENGVEKTSKTEGLDKLLPTLQKIHLAIHSVLNLKLDVVKESSDGTNSILEYKFEQILVLKPDQKDGDYVQITSKGTQIWTANKENLLIHLRVKETDVVKEGYVDLKGVPAKDLTKDAVAPKTPVKGGLCVLV